MFKKPEQNAQPDEVVTHTTPQHTVQQEPAMLQPIVQKRRIRTIAKNNMFLVIGATVFIVSATATGALLFTNNKPSTVIDTAKQLQQNEEGDQKQVAGQTTLINNTFLKTPKKIEDLGLIAPTSSILASLSATKAYYHIGTTEKGKRLLVFYNDAQSEKATAAYLFIEESLETYTFSEQLGSLKADDVTNKVVMGSGMRISELNFATDVTLADQRLRTTSAVPTFTPNSSLVPLSKLEAPKKVGDISAYTLYRSVQKNEPNYQVIELWAVLANMFSVQYSLNGELSSINQNLPITWSSGEQTPVKAFTGSIQCGSAGYSITIENKATLILVGKSKAGQNVFQLPTSSALVKELYEKEYLPNQSNVIDEFKNMTIETFTSKHAYFLVENGYGEFVVFKHTDIFVTSGCTTT